MKSELTVLQIGSGLGIKMRNLVEHVAEYDAWKPGSGYAAICEYLRHRQEDTKPELTDYADISIKVRIFAIFCLLPV